MKKGGILFGLLFLFLILGSSFVLSALPGEVETIENAYDCLENTIQDRTCAQLTLEEQILSLLVVGKCKDEVLAQSSEDNECWPIGNCDLRLTALATLALDNLEINTTVSEDWMLDQKGVPSNLEWFLEIDSEEETNCSVSYDGNEYAAKIFEDETVTIDQNSCLSIETTYGGYWFDIDTSCYDEEFTISCDQDFLTSLFFKEVGEVTLSIIRDTHFSSAGGETYESIDSFCFKDGDFCDYEGSLWASIVLDYLSRDIGVFIPYLLTGKDDNPNFFPDVFLYILTNSLESRTNILEKQINELYWKINGDKYYDSALALLPFQSESIQEKDNTKLWLIEDQLESGCWDNNNVRNTAFILYSIWPEILEEDIDPNITDCLEVGFDCVENVSVCEGNLANYDCSTGVCCDSTGDLGDEDDSLNCESSGYFCMAGIDCGAENILYDYDCSGLQKCCAIEAVEETCFDIGGDKCTSTQYCSEGDIRYTDELVYGETCCIGGTCEAKDTSDGGDYVGDDVYNCKLNFGVCEPFSCSSGHTETSVYTCQYGDLCCVEDLSSPNGSYWWVWTLFGLVILTVIGIMFREKIQEFFLNMGKGKGPGPTNKRPPRFPPGYPRTPSARPPMQKRMLPPVRKPLPRPVRQKSPERAPKELDEVLKKLKNMSR